MSTFSETFVAKQLKGDIEKELISCVKQFEIYKKFNWQSFLHVNGVTTFENNEKS